MEPVITQKLEINLVGIFPFRWYGNLPRKTTIQTALKTPYFINPYPNPGTVWM
jgi:hypothetical protein